MRRVYKKMPGGTTKLTYQKAKPQQAHCNACGAVLPGTPRERPYKMRRMATSKKRPERPYGGVLCSRCSRQTIKKSIPRQEPLKA